MYMNPPPLPVIQHPARNGRYIVLICFTAWVIFTEKYLFECLIQANHDNANAWIASHTDAKAPSGPDFHFRLEPAPTPEKESLDSLEKMDWPRKETSVFAVVELATRLELGPSELFG